MQIIYNPQEVNKIVLGYVQEKLNLDDSNNFHVTVGEDGSIVVLVNEDGEHHDNEQSSAAGDKPRQQKRPRRTKAQIQADEEAAAAAAAEAKNPQAEASTQTGSAETAPAGGNASEQGVEATVTSSTSHGEAEQTTLEKLQAGEVAGAEPVDTTEVIHEPEVQVSEPEHGPTTEVDPADVAAAQPETKPAGVSLFANLRKPQNP